MLKTFFKSIGLIIVSSLIGFLALAVVYALPTSSMVRHAKESIQIYQNEGQYPSWAPGISSATMDNFTDAIMISNAIYQSKVSILENALLNPRLLYNDAHPVQCLINQLEGKTGAVTITYARYWHGYLVLLKPLLLLVKTSHIRMLNMLLQFMLGALVIYLLTIKLGRGYGYSYFLTYLLLNPVTLSMSFQNSTMYYLMNFLSLLILYRTKWVIQQKNICYVCLFAGILTAFFDFLTYPLISLGVPLVIYLSLNRSFANKVDILRTTIVLTLFWGLGYAGMYACKWILGTLLTHQSAIEDAFGQLGHRMSFAASDHYLCEETTTPLMAIARNLRAAFKQVVIIPLCVSLIYGLCILRQYRQKFVSNPCNTNMRLALGFIACYPFFWYIMFCNHSYIHCNILSFREFGISVFAIGCLLSSYALDDQEGLVQNG